MESLQGIDVAAVNAYGMRDGKIVDSRMFNVDTAALVEFLRRSGR
jgi:hypothetical protein